MIRGLFSQSVPVAPVLPGYRRPKSARWIRIRDSIFVTALILVGLIYGFMSAIFPISFFIYMAFPLMFLGAMVVWALPDSGRLPARTIEALFWTFLYAQLIWPNYLAIALPGLPWITVNRLVTAPLAILFLISLSQSRELRQQLKDVMAVSTVVSRCFIALIVLETVTIMFSSTLVASVNKLIDAQIQWNLTFFVAAFLFTKDGRARKFFILYPWLIALLIVVAVFEYRAGAVLWADHIPSFLAMSDESTATILAGSARSATKIYRVQSIFSTALNFAEVLGLTTPFLIYWIMYARRFAVRILCFLALAPLYWMTLQTDSRLGILAFFASFIVFSGIYGFRRWRTRKGDILGPALVLFYPLATALFYMGTMVSGRLHAVLWGNGAQAASTEGRKMQWILSMPKLGMWPFGNGIGRGAETLGTTNLAGVLTIDSYYLVILFEYGVIGFLAWLGLIIGSAFMAIRWSFRDDTEEGRMLQVIATFIIVWLIVKAVLAQDDSHGIAYMVMGMAFGMSWRAQQRAKAAATGTAVVLSPAEAAPAYRLPSY